MKNNPLEVAVRLLFVVALAIIFTWVFNHTRGSIFFSNLLHASIDTPQVVWVPLFLIVDMTSLDLAALIGFGVPALLIIILTRGRPGYQSGENLPMPDMVRQKSILSRDRTAPVGTRVEPM